MFIRRRVLKLRILSAALCILVAASPGVAGPLRFFAVGDLPYLQSEMDPLRDLFDSAVVERTPFLIHVGDIKGGSAPCTDANLVVIADLFRGQPVPVVYTPGDNEWTDCHRRGAGAKDPLVRLAKVRERFFDDPGVLRLDRLGVVRSEDSDGRAYPENYVFMHDDILFVVLHVVGSNNGYQPKDPAAVAEFEARDAANIRLLRDTSVRAKERDASALVLVFHANPFFEKARPPHGFVAFRQALLALMDVYPGPVLAIHGDTHRFKHDRPLIDPGTGQPFTRFVRVEVPGSPIVGGVWIGIDPQAEEPFDVNLLYPTARDRLIP
jgi:hypothetical protein